MLRWFYVAMHLLTEASAARRDARIRFLKAEVEILRRKLGGNRVIPTRTIVFACWPSAELNHGVTTIIVNVMPQTNSRGFPVKNWTTTSARSSGAAYPPPVRRATNGLMSPKELWP